MIRFDASLRSARELAAALDALEEGEGRMPDGARAAILDLYEHVFVHAAFTGRSGRMYRYEGLGSVYWHMVSKLLFSLQERLEAAITAGESRAVLVALAEQCQRVRSGLGFVKDVAEHGSFPTDPHSHTPAHTGAQQPGMTGQVKEGVLLRWGELGVRVEGGRVRFRPVLLSAAEFLTEPVAWPPLGAGGRLEAGTLGFTYCGVPVVYHLGEDPAWARVSWAGGSVTEGDEWLDAAASRALFGRRGEIVRVDVGVAAGSLLI